MGNWNKTTGRCQGLASGEICTATNEWESGYHCSSNVCTAVGIQGTACTNDDGCQIDMICAVS